MVGITLMSPFVKPILFRRRRMLSSGLVRRRQTRDRLQRQSQGYVMPDAFTHGSSAQRTRWFTTGLKSGKVDACDTFNAAQL